jgi:hypothetical protein
MKTNEPFYLFNGIGFAYIAKLISNFFKIDTRAIMLILGYTFKEDLMENKFNNE